MENTENIAPPQTAGAPGSALGGTIDAIIATLNEIACVLTYQPSIPESHKKDIWKKLEAVDAALKADSKTEQANEWLGAGYRLLEKGERVLEGDEFWNGPDKLWKLSGAWKEDGQSTGKQFAGFIYRRRVDQGAIHRMYAAIDRSDRV